MVINQTSEGKAAGWKYIPGNIILFQYLGRRDLIELSICCKSYRNQLERLVFEKLSLVTWSWYNWEFSKELKYSYKLEKALEILKADLGNKLKLVKKFTLNCMVDCSFAETFTKLLPSIKTLKLIVGPVEYGCLGEGLITILKGIEGLEHLDFYDVEGTVKDFSIKNKIFPKSIKSFKIDYNLDYFCESEISVFDTIDSSYINLNSLTIVTNRMLQNLSSGMPNLKEVMILEGFTMDQLNFLKFLKANHQLKKLFSGDLYYNEEILKTVLSSKYLERCSINLRSCEGIESDLPANYSIKHLRINNIIPTPLSLKVINACKNLEILDLFFNYNLDSIGLSKLERRINKLHITYYRNACSTIKEIDASRLFNSVHIETEEYTTYINKHINFKLNNYKVIFSSSKTFILKLIN